MLIDVGFTKTTDDHYVAGQIVTIKPGGSQWTAEEAEYHGIVTLDLSEENYNALMVDPPTFHVDSLENPQTIIQGA